MINQDDEEENTNLVGATRYPCMPSLVAMQQMRNRLNLAYLGKKLMKWSAMATGRELRRISHEIHGVYDDYSDDSRNGYILLARARYFYPHLNSIVIENIPKAAQVTLTNSIKTVSGVRVTQYAIDDTGKDPYELLGIERGGQLIKEAKTVWNHLVKRMIMILELRTSFILVEQANRSATKRFNVLGKLIIPRIQYTLRYIMSELEEKEREENFRLKRFKQLKTKRRDEEVQICRCCFSTFAAGEIMDGDMCAVCKKNVRFKGKVERKIPHVQCIKDGRLQLETVCHLDSERIHLPNPEDNAIHLTYDKTVQINVEDILPLGDILSVTYEGIVEVEIKDEIPFICSQTQKTPMYSYILSVLNSIYDEKEEMAPDENSLLLKKLLRMPTNLPYPCEGFNYLSSILRMPKNIIPAYKETCASQSRALTKKLIMPPDLSSYSIPCIECKSLLNKNIYKSPCEMRNCKKCKPMIHMPLDIPIISCRNCSSRSHLTMPLNIPINLSPCQSLSKNCKILSPVMSFLSKPASHSSYLPYSVPRETLVCHSWTPNIKKLLCMPRSSNVSCSCPTQSDQNYIRMPLNLVIENQPEELDKGNQKYPEEKLLFLRRENQKTPMYSYILSVLNSDDNDNEKSSLRLRKLLRMPANLPYPCESNNYLPQLLRMPKDVIPAYKETCTKCSSQFQAPATNIIMPSDLGSHSIPCVECKSLLNEFVYKNPCEMNNCEKCRPLVHMPSDVPILSCPNCSSRSHLTMPLNIPIHISPCQSDYKSYKNLSPVMSCLSKTASYPSCLPYAAPQETLVCRSWTPNLKKLLHMPRNLSSGSAQSDSRNEPANMTRCSCPPKAHSLYPENDTLHIYIHRLCQPRSNENFIRMPLNLTTENQPCPHSGTVYITKEKSSCSPCIITSSDEEKLFHDCDIDFDHSCASTCSFCFKNSDYEKIVKVETKKKRRPDGKFREEKVVTEKYVVKTLVKPPDICSCSRSDEFEDVVLGIWSCDHQKKEDETNKMKTDTKKKFEYKTDEIKRGTPLQIEPKCLDCRNKKDIGNKYDKNENNHTDNKNLQVICRCNEEKNNDAQTKCECYNIAVSEKDDSENICTLRRLPDLVCCKNEGCLTQNLLKMLTPCEIANQKVASEYNATNPCHSIVIKSADNETIVCTKSNSKEPSGSGLSTSTPRKEVDILPPGCRFFKAKDTSSRVTCTSPISSLEQKMINSLSTKWNSDTGSTNTSAQLNQDSTITKIVKLYLNKNNHKTTSCTDLKIISECLKKSEELTKPYVSPDFCDYKKRCLITKCPFHSHGIAASSSKQEKKCVDNQSQKSCSVQPESFLPVTPRNTETNVNQTDISQNVEFEDEYLKIKQEIDKVIKLTSTTKTQSYYKTLGPEESSKSCCPIPSRLGMPITPTPIISIPKSPLASNIYPSKYINDVNTKDIGTQMKVPICDSVVNPCDTCSKISSLSCHSTKSKNGPTRDHNNHTKGSCHSTTSKNVRTQDHHNHTKGKSCTVCSKKSASLSSNSSKHKTENKHQHSLHQASRYGHQHVHNSDHHHDDNKTDEKCIIKIKVKESKTPLTENDDFYIEGEMEDGSNVVIMRRSKSNISKNTRSDEIQGNICKNCLAILRGDKPSRTPNCNRIHQQTIKCKYCDLLADYSVSGDPSVNASSVDSGNRCCQTGIFSARSSFISSVGTPGEELCIKLSNSPSQSNKTRFTPCSTAPSRTELKTCEQASRIRGYASDCIIKKPFEPCGAPKPRPCKSVCIVCPRTSDACTSTKLIDRYDVRSICDDPRSKRRSRCTPKASTARCASRPLPGPVKSDTTLNKKKRRTRPVRAKSFYESDCKYFKQPCCGCPF